MKSPHTGIKRIFNAFIYSYDGFKSAFQSEAAFRQDLILFGIGTVLAVCLPVELLSKSLLISSLFLILLMELVNTAIETVVDRISPDYHNLSKKAKDIGSLLVLMAFINMILIWTSVIIQYLK